MGTGEGAEAILIGQSVPPPLLEWHSERLKLSRTGFYFSFVLYCMPVGKVIRIPVRIQADIRLYVWTRCNAI
jgi:hypothetical protein